jgi:uncharacterized protein GlcG (DUF336 family)
MAIFGTEQKPVPRTNGISLDESLRIIAAARKKAEDIGVMQNIAVVNAGGNLTAFAHMDGAWIGSIDIAKNKAYTARAFDMSTEALGAMSQPGEMCYGIHASNDLKVIIFGGGIPLIRNGNVVGAVGVSGGTVPQDIEVAEAGVAAFDGNEA